MGVVLDNLRPPGEWQAPVSRIVHSQPKPAERVRQLEAELANRNEWVEFWIAKANRLEGERVALRRENEALREKLRQRDRTIDALRAQIGGTLAVLNEQVEHLEVYRGDSRNADKGEESFTL